MMSWIDAPAKLILMAGVLLGLFLYNLPLPVVKDLTGEGDFVENLSSVILGFVVLFAGLQAYRTRSSCWFSAALVALWMYMRELDYQRQFTPRSIESIGFFRSDMVSLQAKLVVLAILTPFVLAGVHLLWSAWKSLAQAYRNRERWVGYLVASAILVGIALLFEKLLKDPTGVIEEVSELTFAALVLALVFGYFWRSRQPAAAPNGELPLGSLATGN